MFISRLKVCVRKHSSEYTLQLAHDNTTISIDGGGHPIIVKSMNNLAVQYYWFWYA